MELLSDLLYLLLGAYNRMKVILNKPDFDRKNKDNNPVIKTEIEVKELTPEIYVDEKIRDKRSGLRLKSKYRHIIKNEYFFIDYD